MKTSVGIMEKTGRKIDAGKLIAIIESFPAIWNLKDKNHRVKEILINCWGLVAKHLEEDGK